MVVSLDIDEVLFPFLRPFLGYANLKCGTKFQPNVVTDYDLTLLKPVEQVRELIDEFSASSALQSVLPVNGALDGVAILKRLGCTLIAVTGRPESSRKETIEQLERYFPPMPIYFTNQYRGDGNYTSNTKESVCKQLGVEVHVDDQICQVNAIVKHDMRGIFVPNEWQFTHKLDIRAETASNWDKIVSTILS